jgi:hypothetical protein
MKVQSVLVALALLTAAPVAAQDPGLEKRLSDQGYAFEVDADGDYKMVVSWNSDKRSQVVFVSGKTEDLNGMTIREVFAPAASVTRHAIAGEKALELLRHAGGIKMGSWEIRGDIVLLVAKVPDTIGAVDLDKIITMVSELADNKEIELTGGSDDF